MGKINKKKKVSFRISNGLEKDRTRTSLPAHRHASFVFKNDPLHPKMKKKQKKKFHKKITNMSTSAQKEVRERLISSVSGNAKPLQGSLPEICLPVPPQVNIRHPESEKCRSALRLSLRNSMLLKEIGMFKAAQKVAQAEPNVEFHH